MRDDSDRADRCGLAAGLNARRDVLGGLAVVDLTQHSKVCMAADFRERKDIDAASKPRQRLCAAVVEMQPIDLELGFRAMEQGAE